MATIINVYDLNLNLLGVVDDYSSIIWRPSFNEIGDFEIYLGATAKSLDLMRENRIVVRNSDISIDRNGKITYKNPMIIKSIDLMTDIEKEIT